jgi:hypothetical protein
MSAVSDVWPPRIARAFQPVSRGDAERIRLRRYGIALEPRALDADRSCSDFTGDDAAASSMRRLWRATVRG